MKTTLQNIVLFLISFLPLHSFSQNFMMATQFGSIQGSSCTGTVLDAAGNMYVAGTYSGSMDVDPGAGTTTITSSASYDVYLIKLDVSGNLVWAKSFDGTDMEQLLSVTIDGSGNIYLGGFHSGTMDFDPNAGTNSVTATAGYVNMFICKLNSSGNLVWAKMFSGSSYVYCKSLAVDLAGNVYATGFFNGTVDFDAGAGVYNLAAGNIVHMFITRLDAAGNFNWANMIGNGNSVRGHVIKVNTIGGSLHVGGAFNGTVDFDPGAGTTNLASAGNFDMFIALYDQATGMLLYASRMGGTGDDQLHDIAVCNSNMQIYFTGTLNGTADCDPGAGVINFTSAGGRDFIIGYMGAFSPNLIWVKNFGSVQNDNATAICVDNFDNVYATGYFYGTVDFDPNAGVVNIVSANNFFDLFIIKLSQFGNYVWAVGIGGTSSEYPASISIDASCHVIASGHYFSATDFDHGPGVYMLTPPANLVASTYVHKMNQLAPLPVELINFKGTALGNGNELDWETASEKNAAFFTVLKSNDGVNFEEFKKVTASGNSTTIMQYTTFDSAPFQGVTYYRLTQTDFDGQTEFLKTIALTNTAAVKPVSAGVQDGSVVISLQSSSRSDASWVVYDLSGRRLLNGQKLMDAGKNEVSLQTLSFPKGIVLIEIRFDNKKVVERLLIN